jgi:hypothetical protein
VKHRWFIAIARIAAVATVQVDTRSPVQIIESIQEQGRVVNDALARLSALLEATPGAVFHGNTNGDEADAPRA